MSAAPIQRIGFLGIGNMGMPMASRLAERKFAVTAYDVVAGRADAFAKQSGGNPPARRRMSPATPMRS